MGKRTIPGRAKRKYSIEYDCDVCGKANASNIALIDGDRLAVCSTCKKFGRILHGVSLAALRKAKSTELEEIVDNYPSIIKEKRRKLGLSITQISEKIQERPSYLKKIEQGNLTPSLRVARKLQRVLRVKIIQPPESKK